MTSACNAGEDAAASQQQRATRARRGKFLPLPPAPHSSPASIARLVGLVGSARARRAISRPPCHHRSDRTALALVGRMDTPSKGKGGAQQACVSRRGAPPHDARRTLAPTNIYLGTNDTRPTTARHGRGRRAQGGTRRPVGSRLDAGLPAAGRTSRPRPPAVRVAPAVFPATSSLPASSLPASSLSPPASRQ